MPIYVCISEKASFLLAPCILRLRQNRLNPLSANPTSAKVHELFECV